MLNEQDLKYIRETLPFFDNLSKMEQDTVVSAAIRKNYDKGALMYDGGADCVGLMIILSGKIRAYTVSEKGREVSLYRLLKGDVCIMGAGCMLDNIDFTVSLTAEDKSDIIIIPSNIYKTLNEKPEVNSFTLKLISERFSDVMWVVQQYLFLGTAERLARVLGELSEGKSDNVIEITHEELARETGTLREVITRLLKKMEADGILSLSRGKITVIDKKALSRV